jgi:hypothetical protein
MADRLLNYILLLHYIRLKTAVLVKVLAVSLRQAADSKEQASLARLFLPVEDY